MSNTLNLSETIEAPPTPAEKYIEWFTVDVIIVTILLAINFGLFFIFTKNRVKLSMLHKSKDKDDVSNKLDVKKGTSTNPLDFRGGLFE